MLAVLDLKTIDIHLDAKGTSANAQGRRGRAQAEFRVSGSSVASQWLSRDADWASVRSRAWLGIRRAMFIAGICRPAGRQHGRAAREIGRFLRRIASRPQRLEPARSTVRKCPVVAAWEFCIERPQW
jgi:hypothetical protein